MIVGDYSEMWGAAEQQFQRSVQAYTDEYGEPFPFTQVDLDPISSGHPNAFTAVCPQCEHTVAAVFIQDGSVPDHDIPAWVRHVRAAALTLCPICGCIADPSELRRRSEEPYDDDEDEQLADLAQEQPVQPVEPDPQMERLLDLMEQRIEHAVSEMGERLRGLSADTARIAEEVTAELREQLTVEARDGHQITSEVTASCSRTEYGLDLRVVIDGEPYAVTVLSLSV